MAAAGPDGIVCIGDKGEGRSMRGMLKICTIPRNVILDAYWPVRTKQLTCTVAFDTINVASLVTKMDRQRSQGRVSIS